MMKTPVAHAIPHEWFSKGSTNDCCGGEDRINTYKTAEGSLQSCRPALVSESAKEKLHRWLHKSAYEGSEEEVPVYLLHPESNARTFWDIFTGITVVLISFLLPFEICFVDSQGIPLPLWLALLEMALTYVFMFDILVNFLTAVQDNHVSPPNIVTDLKYISWRYCSGWFLLDLLAAFPFFLFEPSTSRYSGNKLTLGKLARFSRFLKLIRLFRLLRLLKLPKLFVLFEAFERKIHLHPGLVRMNHVLFSVVFGVHFAACLWFVIGRTHHYCDPWPESYLDEQECSWISQFGYIYGRYSNQTVDLRRQYVASFYFSLTTISTVGYGDISGKTFPEQIFAMLLMIFGVLWSSFVIGSTASIVESFGSRQQKIYQHLRDANLFINEANIPEGLGKRIQNHFRAVIRRHGVYLAKNYNTHEIIQGLNRELKQEVILYIQRHIIHDIEFLKNKSDHFQAAVAASLQSATFERDEYIIEEGSFIPEIFFLTEGNAIATVGKQYFCVYEKGSRIGDSGFLNHGIHLMSVFTYGTCNLESLSYQDINKLWKIYGPELEEIRVSARKELELISEFQEAAQDQELQKRIRKRWSCEISQKLEEHNDAESPKKLLPPSGMPHGIVSHQPYVRARFLIKPTDVNQTGLSKSKSSGSSQNSMGLRKSLKKFSCHKNYVSFSMDESNVQKIVSANSSNSQRHFHDLHMAFSKGLDQLVQQIIDQKVQSMLNLAKARFEENMLK